MKERETLKYLSGFSALNKEQKIKWISSVTGISEDLISKYSWHDKELALIIDTLSENTIAHFVLPLGVAPNFKVNGIDYILPLVSEESSVVAAIAKASKTWYQLGGFSSKVLGLVKKGQIHFFWKGEFKNLEDKFPFLKKKLLEETSSLTENMKTRNGGIIEIRLLDKTAGLKDYYQLDVDFNTGEAMGANFINSVLEKMAEILEEYISEEFPEISSPEINMAILSNYTPECLVKAFVECPVSELDGIVKGMSANVFVERFEKAVAISKIDISRAVTHNKGIFNGIDALALATGNDWRAIEAAGHAYASRNGKYSGLSDVKIENDIFRFSITLPINIGTIGGVTTLHPLAGFSMKILNDPSVNDLMQLFAAVGLASNFSAISALISNGIQAGHMKMHLTNLLLQLNATNFQSKKAIEHFKNRNITYAAVKDFLNHVV